jgi:murein DD-endopeptidase MepM/ murein hydrolase activator NlpD
MQNPIPAGNDGRVVFTGPLGIYGETVILDHGWGLFSMYSHMSVIDVSPGASVAKGDILGRTGQTGMAGGDHLHFAVIVQGVFVDPVEWWDPHWVKDNIDLKLK